MNKKSIIMLLFIVVVPILLAVGYFYSDKISFGGNNILSSKNWVIPEDWETYKSDGGKYEIKHPSGFRVSSDGPDRTDFNPPESTYPHFTILISKSGYQSVDDIIKLNEINLSSEASSAGYNYTYKINDVNIGGAKGKQIYIDFTDKGVGNSAHILAKTFVIKNGLLYNFSCYWPYKISESAKKAGVSSDSRYDCGTFDKMMSTFKFK